MEKQYAYIIAILLVSVFLVYKELKRANSARLFLRLFAVLIAAASLLFLIIPIKYDAVRKGSSRVLNYLTPGATASDLRTEQYYTSDSTVLKVFSKQKVTYIPDLAYYLYEHKDISNLVVYGNGLTPSERKQIAINITFHAPAVPAGIISCSWPKRLSSSETFSVQGIYNNTSKVRVKLMLQGLGTNLDSITINANKQASFSLQSQPKQIGKAVYQISVLQDTGIVESEELPFQVIERPKVKILVLASFPDFEYKFLRNWLLENRYPAFFRTRVSKDKFSTDQVNLDVKESGAITAATFKKYDLVIADDEELARLGGLTANFSREIEAGLGLVVRLNEAKSISSFSKRFQVSGSRDSISRSIKAVITAESKTLKPLPVDQPLFIVANPNQLRLVEDPGGKILTSLAMTGSGRVAATAIATTFNWVLSGANSDYATYWSAVINQTAKKIPENFQWTYGPKFPAVNDQVALTFQSTPEQELPTFRYNGKSLPVQQHMSLPFYWQATFWPAKSGWNTFEVNPGGRQDVFIYKRSGWKALKGYNLIEANKLYAKKPNNYKEVTEAQVETIEKAVSKWIFVCLFFISMAFLWFETKILQ